MALDKTVLTSSQRVKCKGMGMRRAFQVVPHERSENMICRQSMHSKLRSSAKLLKIKVDWDETSNGFNTE